MAQPAASAPSKRRGFLLSFAAGGSAGVVTKTCVQPLERVKNILQIQGATSASETSAGVSSRTATSGKYNGILGTLRTVSSADPHLCALSCRCSRGHRTPLAPLARTNSDTLLRPLCCCSISVHCGALPAIPEENRRRGEKCHLCGAQSVSGGGERQVATCPSSP